MAGCKTDFLCTLEREVNNAFLPLVTQECHGSERVKHLDLNKLLLKRKANISTVLSKVAHSNSKTTNFLWENLLTRESCVNTEEYNILHGPGAREWIRKAYTISYYLLFRSELGGRVIWWKTKDGPTYAQAYQFGSPVSSSLTGVRHLKEYSPGDFRCLDD